jgi:two-component system, chemotaxis family, sensor kinase CheA
MDQMEAIRETFFQECDEQLTALEAGLAMMEEGDISSDTVNAVFRAVHSIKGGAGAFKLNELVSFAHVFETALDRVRSGSLVPDAILMKLFLKSVDVLSDLVSASREGSDVSSEISASVIAEFDAILDNGTEQVEEDDFADIDFQPMGINIGFGDLDVPVIDDGHQNNFRIEFQPFRELYDKANEPLMLFRELGRIGQLNVACNFERLPHLDTLDPLESYLAWSIDLKTDATIKTVTEIFEFVEGDCTLTISEIKSQLTPDANLDIESILSAIRNTPSEKAESVVSVNMTLDAPQISESLAHPAEIKLAVKGPVVAAISTIRVDLERVDRLINLVGELVINQAMLTQRFRQGGYEKNAEVSTSLEELEHLTRDLQESVMAIRAQPVKPLFQRMARIVREVADATGKEVRLKSEGEATEIDKTVIELLADPLTHMIRNGVDHGLESSADRIASGKPSEGVIKLSAAHRSGRVVIEVSDDGGGINRTKVLEAAKRKGLVALEAILSDTEIDNLLFLPGFSTASSISNISGRGVGMDVVKRSIQALGGRITISSKPKIGSTFSMSLPLTLAVLDGIVVSIDNQTFVIPLTSVVETLQPNLENIHPLGEGSFVIRVREIFVPLIDVGAEIGLRPKNSLPPNGVAILVETENKVRNALLVDSIIKSLETNYGKANGVAAATILGDGRVAMILDVDALISSQGIDVLPTEDRLAKVG